MPSWDDAALMGWRRGARIGSPPRASRWLAALLALALLVPAAARADTPPAADEPSTATTPSAFSGAEAYRHVVYLADRVGSRTAGSDKEGDAATYLAGEMARFGLQTEIQLFPVQLYDERTAVVTPLAPAAAPIETSALMYSGSGTVAGELVDAQLGRPSDSAAGDLPGQGRPARARAADLL